MKLYIIILSFFVISMGIVSIVSAEKMWGDEGYKEYFEFTEDYVTPGIIMAPSWPDAPINNPGFSQLFNSVAEGPFSGLPVAPQSAQTFPIATPYHPPDVPPPSPDPAGFIDITKGNLDWQHQSGFGGHGGVGMSVYFIPGVTLESAEALIAKEYFSFDYRIVIRNENPLELWIFMNEYDAKQLAEALKEHEEVIHARAGMIA